MKHKRLAAKPRKNILLALCRYDYPCHNKHDSRSYGSAEI